MSRSARAVVGSPRHALNSTSLISLQTISDVDLRWRAAISFYASTFCFPLFFPFLPLSLAFLSQKNTRPSVTFHPFPQTSRSVVPFGPHYQHDYSLLHRKMLVSTMISFFFILDRFHACRPIGFSPLDSLND